MFRPSPNRLHEQTSFVYNAVTMPDIFRELQTVSSVEEGEGCTAYALDGCVPQTIIKPVSAPEVRDALEVCHRLQAPGVVWGGGTHVGIGSPPRQYVWAMDMRGLASLKDYSPGDLVVTVEAGMTVTALQSLLRPHQQWLPLDVPLPDMQTVGGVIASQGAGMKSQRYGLPREWLLAVRVVLASGEEVKAGVGVVKNVAGYDLPRLFAGSWGTLGVMVELTFKVAPLPEVSLAVRSDLTDVGRLFELRDALDHPLLQAEMLEVTYGREGRWRLYCGLAGFEEDVGWQFDLLRERTDADWAQVEADEVTWLRDRYLLADAGCRCRCVVPPAQTADLLAWTHQHFPDADLQAHFGAGIVYVWWQENVPGAQALRELRAQTRALEGFCILEKAPAEIKREVGVWDSVRGGVSVARRLKEGFDPQGILAPGRFVEGL